MSTGKPLIRRAKHEDIPMLVKMIYEMAKFLRLEHYLRVTEEKLKKHIFDTEKPLAQFLIVEVEGEVIGYTSYLFNFSTFRGDPGLYIEDVFVREHFRRRQVGRAIIHALSQIATAKGCGRMEWVAPEGNQDVQDFYRSLGVPTVDGWQTFRATNIIWDMNEADPSYEADLDINLPRKKKEEDPPT